MKFMLFTHFTLAYGQHKRSLFETGISGFNAGRKAPARLRAREKTRGPGGDLNQCRETSSTPASTRMAPAICAREIDSPSSHQPKKIVNIGPSVPIIAALAEPM